MPPVHFAVSMNVLHAFSGRGFVDRHVFRWVENNFGFNVTRNHLRICLGNLYLVADTCLLAASWSFADWTLHVGYMCIAELMVTICSGSIESYLL